MFLRARKHDSRTKVVGLESVLIIIISSYPHEELVISMPPNLRLFWTEDPSSRSGEGR